MPLTKSRLILTSLPLITFSITLILFFYPEKSKGKEDRKEGEGLSKALDYREPKWRISNSNLNLKLNGL